MGFLKDIQSNLDPQAFPGATFVIEGEPPEEQCSEAKIEGVDATTRSPPFNELKDIGAFTGFNLVGKKCTIIVSPTGNTGTFDIDWNDDDYLEFAPNPGNSVDVEYYIHNGGSLIITRDVPSFAAFIHTAGYAYTIKGNKLYTNIPSNLLQPACSILFDPLT